MIDSFTLSAESVDILGEDLQLDLRQFPFEIPHFCATLDERARLRKDVWSELERRRLADRGRAEPELEQALQLLHRPEVAVAVTSYDGKSDAVYRARVVAAGRAGVVAVQDERGLRIEFIDVRGLARVCVGLLPEAPAGKLDAGTIAVAGEQKPQPEPNAEPDSWLGAAQPSASGRGGGDMRKVERIMALPLRSVGYFVVTGVDADGQQVRLPAISWRDTEEGRYSVTTRRNHDGQRWNTFSPADKPRLARYLDEQLASVRPR
ncbi:ESX secretion-associated protein EspG [Saccharopolyspora hirsuta]|uniref:ESX secretion-associated protein EspG n=1 Tax=Saccharopolyspora hirsuta TaxID=1837 RepID=A0A5M7BWI3_SACHI|nr:ESX secretion-associated protein EspG [Saccharopolyspora hirsuta]KAA5832488.1 ESX secretion-associated protein EspG [Saccharopolyspora hirsuta]